MYHVLLKGTEQQVLFMEDEDRERLVEMLKLYKVLSGYKLFAYCLMENHFHLLLKIENEDLGLVVRRIAGSYVYWFNWKYYRRGSLFHERFKSEPVENEACFLTVLRYIHLNPVRAGLCDRADEYRFSSYNDIVNSDGFLIDVDEVSGFIKREDFIRFHDEENNDTCLDVNEKGFRLSDRDAKMLVQKISKCKSPDEFQLLEEQLRDKYIKKLRGKGLSIRQVCRLTGISFAIVRRMK